jgi:hypothetical protein
LTVVLDHVLVSFFFSATPLVLVVVVPVSGSVWVTVVSVIRGLELEQPGIIERALTRAIGNKSG